MVWKRDRDVKFVFIGPQTSYSRKIFRNVTDPRIISLGPVDMETKTAALGRVRISLCAFSTRKLWRSLSRGVVSR